MGVLESSAAFPLSPLGDACLRKDLTAIHEILEKLGYKDDEGAATEVVELDFLYPSEGIHRRWDGSYHITSTSATTDQSAIVLSIPRRKPADETQETLRTSAFPKTHVKVKSIPLAMDEE